MKHFLTPGGESISLGRCSFEPWQIAVISSGYPSQELVRALRNRGVGVTDLFMFDPSGEKGDKGITRQWNSQTDLINLMSGASEREERRRPDLYVSAFLSVKIGERILRRFRDELINLHASPGLYAFPGPNPIEDIHEMRVPGGLVMAQQVINEIDKGPVLGFRYFPLSVNPEYTASNNFVNAAADLLQDLIPLYKNGEISPVSIKDLRDRSFFNLSNRD